MNYRNCLRGLTGNVMREDVSSTVREPIYPGSQRHDPARRLNTGETGVMTRSQDKGVRVCVHDGDEVVYQKSVALPKEEVRGLPFVTLLGSARPVQTPCLSVRELYWGIRVLGWLAVPHCAEEEGVRGRR